MLDFLTKEHVRSFCVSTFRKDRSFIKSEVILGRTYYKTGTVCATTMVTDCWKVWDSSVERFKYVYLAGVARQHPSDICVKYSDGVEIAHENAMTNPVLRMEFDTPISYELVESMMWNYIEGMPIQFVKTKQELEFDDFRNNCDWVD